VGLCSGQLVHQTAHPSDGHSAKDKLLKLTTTAEGDMQQHYRSVILCDLWVAPKLNIPDHVLI
jgi:hypothetical protein